MKNIITKRFFLAALTAVALTLGFTACSDDDENERFAGDYKLSGFVSISSYNIDDTEHDCILSTYCTAFGITEGYDFIINGKDSADCVSNIQKCCKKAEAILAGQTWNGAYTVNIMHEDGKISLYAKKYGESGENSYEPIKYYPFVKLVEAKYDNSAWNYYWKAIETSEIKDDAFITGFFTQCVHDNKCCPPYLEWPYSLYHNLCSVTYANDKNQYVAIPKPYYTMDEVTEMIKTNDPKLNTLIGDVKVLYMDSNKYPKEFTYKGAKYEVCAGNGGTESPNDLNYKAGGPCMYLYVSHDIKFFNRVLNAKWTTMMVRCKQNIFYEDTEGERQESSELVQGIYMDSNGNMSDHYEDGIDFQKGTNIEYYVKMRVGYLPLDEVRKECYEAVDLGLFTGTKWANMNLGANSAEDYGYLFAWGETVPCGMVDYSNAQNYNTIGSYRKLRFEWTTYKWCNGTQVMSKYNQDDCMTMLESEDDAATVNLGAHWRTPSKTEIRELIDACDWTWTTLNGVAGYQVKSKTNGNSIFLPAAGYYYKNELYNDGDYVYLWSANRDSDVPQRAYYLSRSTKGYNINTEQRCLGLPIRAVYVE